MTRLFAAFALFAVGCNRSGDTEKKPAPEPAIEAAAPAEAKDPRRFSHLVHVAGRGELDIEGESHWKASFEGGPAVDAELSRPYSAVADAAGHIYIADKEAHAVRRVEPDGTIRTFAGTNVAGNGPDGPSPATKVALNMPNGLHVQAGVVYILDLNNDKIRKVLPGGAMQTLATVKEGIDTGRGLWVAPDESHAYISSKNALLEWKRDEGTRVLGDGFSSLANLVVDDRGAVYVADRGGDRVHRVAADGAIFHVAGGGSTPAGKSPARATEIELDGPRGLVRYEDGTLLIATHEGGRIVEVDPDGLAHVLYDPDLPERQRFDAGAVTLRNIRSMTGMPSGDVLLVHGDRGQVHQLVQND